MSMLSGSNALIDASPAVIIVTLLVIGLFSLLVYFRNLQSAKSESSGAFTGKVPEKNGIQVDHVAVAPSNQKLRNVFDVKQKNHLPHSTASSGDKPFRSSYYYAHNDPNRIGGYKDGLKMEDYVMNGPKLLSRNGTKIDQEKKESSDDIKHAVDSTRSSSTLVKNTEIVAGQSATRKRTGNSIQLTKYLWDDDGNKEGIAKILIESLPGKNSIDSMIRWDEMGFVKEDVMVSLVGEDNEGMLLQLRRTGKGDPLKYHLLVPQLYEKVTEVKAVVKKKRLVVKLIKKNAGKVWPRLSSAVVKSPSIHDIDYIDEDLFKN